VLGTTVMAENTNGLLHPIQRRVDVVLSKMGLGGS
jgi:hypothetical protein